MAENDQLNKPPKLLGTFRFEVRLRRSSAARARSALSGRGPSGPGAGGSATEPGQMLGDGGFQECSGLDLEMEVQESREGGRNYGPIQHIGRAKHTPIVLKRGMFYGEDGQVNGEIWQWMSRILTNNGPPVRYDGTVEVKGEDDAVVARWEFIRGLPARVQGPQLNAKTGDIAIEELHIAHEGLSLEGW
jgi:phage tail-like protein